MKFTNIKRRTFLQLTTAGAATLALPGILRAQNYKAEYKLSVVGNGITITDSAIRWAELVKEKTEGRINIKVYPGSQLVGGDQSRELIALRQGIVDCIVQSSINASSQIKELNILSLPFLLPDSKAFDAVVGNPEVKAMLEAGYTQRGSTVLAWAENGFRQLANSKRAVRRPEDLVGLKIRYAVSPIFAEMFEALGANPLQMSFADLQPALATGAVDGLELPVKIILASKLDQLSQKYVTLWNYANDAFVYQFKDDLFAGFSDEDREIVRACALQAAEEIQTFGRQGLDPHGDRATLDELAGRGVEIVELTEEELEAFRAATKPVYDRWVSPIGEELVRKSEEAVAASRS